jgi:hypothetical protein
MKNKLKSKKMFARTMFFFVENMNIYFNSWTSFHDGREVILSHHFLTFGRDSKKLPSPSLTSLVP